MNFEEIYDECNAILENKIMDSLLLYFQKYPTQRKEFAKNFKQAFCALVDDILLDLKKEEKEKNA